MNFKFSIFVYQRFLTDDDSPVVNSCRDSRVPLFKMDDAVEVKVVHLKNEEADLNLSGLGTELFLDNSSERLPS